MARPKRSHQSIKVRLNTTTAQMPSLAISIITHLLASCKDSGRQWATFRVDKLPGSVNHMKPFRTHRLADWVAVFRQEVRNSIVRSGIDWKPTGVSSAVILLATPLWVTQQHKVRELDADNKIKPIFDAIQQATGQPDEGHWSFHVFKVPSKKEKLTVWLFDQGDVIEYFT